MPIKFDYLIIDLAPDYSWTVIGVPDQKYIWIMAREPKLSEERYKEIILRIQNLGYNLKGIQKIQNQ